ncbi:DUF1097 family protein [Clostridium sp.]|uniref:DUF1097 family protein n=1 Tax=Clostridium sp. TaxID=1506 RepID=UPI001A5CB90D|nr:DUF1097 family protein [Clostridium sp.]MBK5236456.1 DUF1097 family protein [Clostridium sp.]
MVKKGISKHKLISGLIVSTWLCVTLFLLGIFGIHNGWPAFLALMFFIMAGAKNDSLKPIFIGGLTGLLMAKVLIFGVENLVPMGIGVQSAIYIMVFITVFLLIVLEDLNSIIFNSYAFGYFTIALIPSKQATVEWVFTLYLGGAFFIGGVIILSRYVGKLRSNKAVKIENKA